MSSNFRSTVGFFVSQCRLSGQFYQMHTNKAKGVKCVSAKVFFRTFGCQAQLAVVVPKKRGNKLSKHGTIVTVLWRHK